MEKKTRISSLQPILSKQPTGPGPKANKQAKKEAVQSATLPDPASLKAAGAKAALAPKASIDCPTGDCGVRFGGGVSAKNLLKPSRAARVVYGEDDRKDIYQVQDPKMRNIARSAFTLADPSDLIANGQMMQLQTSGYRLCETEPFAEQKSFGWCSGTLIGKDRNLLLTAGHCISYGDEGQVKMVLDYAVTDEARPNGPTELPASSVYDVAEVVYSVVDSTTGADWALVRLDRSVDDRESVPLADVGSLQVGDDLVMIGYPSGLPVKVDDGAEAQNIEPEGYFQANLDAYGGNSGSMVLNADGSIVGILVRGSQDYNWVTDDSGAYCRVSNVLPNDQGAEDSTKISEEIVAKVELAEQGKRIVAPMPSSGARVEELYPRLYAQAWRMVQVYNREIDSDETSSLEDREFVSKDEAWAMPKLLQGAIAGLRSNDPRGIAARDLATAAAAVLGRELGKASGKSAALSKIAYKGIGDEATRAMIRWAIEDVYGKVQTAAIYGQDD